MMRKNTIVLLLVLTSFNVTAQDQEETKINTIDNQFSTLIDNSSTYQSFKVIKISELGLLQRNIRDSLSLLKTTIVDSELQLSKQEDIIKINTQEIDSLTKEVQHAQENRDTIKFLSISTEKDNYNFIMWSLISVLVFFSAFLFYKYKKTHIDTADALKRLDETEDELENLRKRSLEREQKVRRELQDEINKNKNKSTNK